MFLHLEAKFKKFLALTISDGVLLGPQLRDTLAKPPLAPREG